MVDVLGAQGSFVAMNNTVSQSVPHLHVHVVPRTKGDGLRGFFWPRTEYDSDEHAADVAARLRDRALTRNWSECVAHGLVRRTRVQFWSRNTEGRRASPPVCARARR